MVVVAHIHTQFPEKFGIPRQSGLVPSALGSIVMEPEYRNPDAFKGIEEFSHLWLLWEFSKAKQDGFHATVAPPRLGGKERRGVFATRSPFRPNSIGLSCVKLEKIEEDERSGNILIVSGIDMKDGTPIFDIKPYIPYADMIPDAKGGFSDGVKDHRLNVFVPEMIEKEFDSRTLSALKGVLADDPRPAYQDDGERIYRILFAGKDIGFRVENGNIEVTDCINAEQK